MACLSCFDAFRDKWVSRNLRDRAKSFSWEMTLLTLGMFLHTQTESVLIKMAWTGWNTLFHACVCVRGMHLLWPEIHINSEENKNFSLLTLHLTGQLKLTSTQTSTQGANVCPEDCNHVVQISESCYKFVESLTNVLSLILFKLLLLRWRKRGNLWY